MDGRKRSTAETGPPELSSDIVLFHILPRLPVKSVLRFRSVSKQWHSFLTTPVFGKMQLHHVTNDDHKLIILSTPIAYRFPYTFRTIDCERPKDSLTASLPLPFDVGPLQSILILTSLHGLVCLGIITITKRKNPPFTYGYYPDLNYSELVLWNPATRDYKILSKPSSDHKECYATRISKFRLYYSSCDDDYKIVRLTTHPNVYMYSLKSDSWRKVETRTEDFQRTLYTFPDNRWLPSVMLNDNIYFLEHVRKPRSTESDNYTYSILKFDTKTENLQQIAAPSFGNQRSFCLSFTVQRGCIDFWVCIENSKSRVCAIELWRMDGDGDWTKVVNYGRTSSSLWNHKPLHLTRNGDLLVYVYSRRQLYLLSMKTKTEDKFLSYKTSETMECNAGAKYIETVVSPNQYMK